MYYRLFYVILVLVTALATGCGDDDDDADAGQDGGADDSFTVSVLVGSCAPAASEGVLVTFDAPGGERMEATTGPDGQATFDGLDFSLGTAAVTASLDGYEMVTYVGLTADLSPLSIVLPGTGQKVALSGTASGMTDDNNYLLVQATACGSGYWQNMGTTYEIDVPEDEPFSLFGLEFSFQIKPSGQGVDQTFHRWYWEEMNALEGDSTHDFTFGEELVPASVSGSFDIALGEHSPLAGDQGYGYMRVYTFQDNWLTGVGWPASIDINADQTAFDYTAEYLDGDFIVSPVTHYNVMSKNGSTTAFHFVREAGFPKSGSHSPDFIAMPVLDPPDDDGERYQLAGGGFAWQAFDTDVHPSLVVTLPSMGMTWWIHAPVDATSMTVPAPPAGAEATALIEEYTLSLLANLWMWRPGEGELEGIWYADVTQTANLKLK